MNYPNMARLETQINQIYYLPSEARSVSLILHDEVLSNSSHVFLIADFVQIQKKTQTVELKKVSEIILNTFKENKKLSGENLFESSLAQINQSLADLAHAGKRSWVGKLSALIVLKSSNDIFLASAGTMSSMLYRNSQFVEILEPEKPGAHPLKTFSNFTAGKLKDQDILLLTTSNLTNYVALQHLTRLMADFPVEEVSAQVSKILKDTAGDQEGFASFFVSLTKATEPVSKFSAPAIAAASPLPVEEEMNEVSNTAIAPAEAARAAASNLFNRIPKVRLPKFSIGGPKWAFWQHLSPWAKFCLVMFAIAILLLSANIVKYTIHKHRKVTQTQSATLIDQLNKDINDAQSALIYRNQSQALELLSAAKSDLEQLKTVDSTSYAQYQSKVADLSNQINHITVAENPTALLTLKHPATDFTRAGKGLVIVDSETGNITTYKTATNDQSGKDLFLLNKIGAVTGVAHIPNVGHIVTTSSEMYLVNTSSNQFDLLHIYPKTNLSRLRLVAPDKLYTLDKANNQVLRIQFSTETQIDPVSILHSPGDLSQVTDLGVDTDVWLLSPTNLAKYTNGNLTSYKLQQPSDQITTANRLYVGSNIYILESAKKRLLIYGKKDGSLLTQIYLPNTTDLRDFSVDEGQRSIYLLDSNKVLFITF